MEKIITKNCLKSLKEQLSISGIYKITSPSNKVYIGQSINLHKRLKSYFSPKSASNQTILRRSFDKYGVDNHVFEIIELCHVDKLNIRERYWQEFFKYKSLNCRLTGTKDKSGTCSEQTKMNISNSLKKSKKSYQHLKRKIYQYDNKGLFIREWDSLRDASRELCIQSSQISRSTKSTSNNKSARGFLWSYEKLDFLDGSIGQECKKLKVMQFDLFNNLINTFDSITLASKETNTSKSSIIRCCKNKQKTANNFIWRYLKN